MTIGKHPERRDDDLPLLTLMGEPSRPKKEESPAAATQADNNNGAFKYPELPFRKKSSVEPTVLEKKKEDRPIAQLFKLNEKGDQVTQIIDFGDPEKWGDVHQTPAICDEIKGIVELKETIETNGDYDGPILVELKNGRKFFSAGFKDEQTCYELDTKLNLLEIKAQYWK